jgi:hypothetical protein
MASKMACKAAKKTKRINPTNKGGKPASTPQIPGENTGSTPILRVGDRVQVICPEGWAEAAYANTGQIATVQLIGAGIRLKGKVNVQLDEPPAPHKRQDIWIHVERLETLEGKRQMVLPLEPNMQTSTQAEELPLFSVGDRVQVIKGCCKGHVSTIEKIDQTLKHSVRVKSGGRYSPSFLELVMDTPEEQIAAICREGPIAPDGCWIETGKVSGKAFRQAWYRSRSPCFAPARKGDLPKKTQYLGAVGGDRHKEAVKAIERRNKLKKWKKIAQQKAGW